MGQKGVDRGIPGLVRGGVGKLERPGDIPGGVNVGVIGLQEFIGLDRAPGRNAQFFQAKAFQVGGAANGNQNGVEGNPHILAGMLGNQDFSPFSMTNSLAR